jgi:hypothetical protein
MRCRPPVLFLALLLAGLSSPLTAETVRVDGVEGRVLYGAGDRTPSVPVKAGQTLPAGTFSADANGILYLSTFSGSELRLAESGTLRFDGVEEPCPVGHDAGHRSTFRLRQGKLRVTIRHPESPPHCYRIVLVSGSASVESGQCVMCRHGEGTYIYVARGVTMLARASAPLASPPRGAEAVAITPVPHTDVVVEKPIMLTGNGSVAVLESGGAIRVRALSAVSAATQNCLLAGFKADAASGDSAHPADASGPVVSPTQ